MQVLSLNAQCQLWSYQADSAQEVPMTHLVKCSQTRVAWNDQELQVGAATTGLHAKGLCQPLPCTHTCMPEACSRHGEHTPSNPPERDMHQKCTDLPLQPRRATCCNPHKQAVVSVTKVDSFAFALSAATFLRKINYFLDKKTIWYQRCRRGRRVAIVVNCVSTLSGSGNTTAVPTIWESGHV